MTRNEFLQALDARLDGLTDAERQGILDYYGEIIDDSAEDGMGEEAAVALLGDVGAIARELLENRPAGGEGAADKCVRSGEGGESKDEASAEDSAHMDGGQSAGQNALVVSRSQSIPGAFSKVVVRDFNAALILLPSQSGEVALVTQESRYVTYKITREDGVLTIEKQDKRPWYQRIFDWMKDLTLTVRLPGGVSLDAQTINADVSATGLEVCEMRLDTRNAVVLATSCRATGALVMTTDNGAIVARDCSAQNLSGKTSNSKASLAGVRAEAVHLKSSNGAMTVEDVEAGRLACSTTNGGISLCNVSAAEVSASTSNGRVTFSGLRASQSIELCTTNASIRGALPGTLGDYAVDSGTSNGRNSLPERSEGAIRLSAHTSNGAIDLKFEGN